MNFIREFKSQHPGSNKLLNDYGSGLLRRVASDCKDCHCYLNKELYVTAAKSDHYQRVHAQRNTAYIPPRLYQVTRKSNDPAKPEESMLYGYVSVQDIVQNFVSSNIDWLAPKLMKERQELLQLEREQTQAFSNKTFSSITDGFFGKRLLGKIKLEFFCDDLQIAKSNGLGAQQNMLKVCMGFADLPYPCRCKSNDLDIVLVASRDEMKQRGITLRGLLKQLNKDLQKLADDCIDVSWQGHVFSVEVCSILGDNKGINEILGFKGCFSPSAFVCRLCGAKGLEVQNITLKPLITEIPEGSEKEYGITGSMAFDLPGITRWNICPVDPMHDLWQGVVPKFLHIFFKNLVKFRGIRAKDIIQRFKEARLPNGKVRIQPDLHLKAHSGRGVRIKF